MKKYKAGLLLILILSANNLFGQQYFWTKKTNYGGGEMYDPFSFVIGTKGYAGSGFDAARTYHVDFWEWDQVTNVWTQKANFAGDGREGSRAFSIGSKGYVTAGYSPNGGFLKDLWEYDPSINSWTQKKSLPATARYLGIAFTLLNKGYFGLGNGSGAYFNDLWQYDPTADSWTQKAAFPGTPRGAISSFLINDEAYVGLGSNVSLQSNFQDFYKYNPETDSWIRIADFPGHPRNGAYVFNINGKGFVLCGYDYVHTFPTIFQDFYDYDPEFNTWSQLPDFPGKHVVEGIQFEIGTRGYIGVGSDTSSFYHFQNSFWEYGPDSIITIPSQTNVTCFNGSNGTASVSVTQGVRPFTYRWSPGGQTTSAVSGLTAGTYSVLVTDSLGLTATDTIRITQPSKVVASASGNLSVCSGQSTTLTGLSSGGTGLQHTFSWDGTATGTTYSITPTSSGRHFLITHDSVGCVSDTFFFMILIRQKSTGTSNVHICNGQSVTLPDGSSVNPTASTAYTTHLTNAAGCDSAITTNVTVNNNTSSNASVGICSGQSVTLPDGSSVHPMTSTTYTTHITNAAGCDSVITTHVTVGQNISVTICASSTVGCGDHTIYIGYGPQSVTLTASTSSTGATYQWYKDGTLISGATSRALVVTTAGSYNVMISAGGCSSSLMNTTPIVINIVDVRCGSHNQKVLICHVPSRNCGGDPETLCVDACDVPGYLCHGDCLGACAPSHHNAIIPHTLPSRNLMMTAYPNPSSSSSTIEFRNMNASDRTLIELFTHTGMRVSTLFDDITDGGVNYRVILDGSLLPAGIYLCKMSSGDQTINYKIVLMK